MVVGEIGISRREFLYEVQWWEVNRIIRGYRRRGTLERQLLAEVVYSSMFSMRDPKGKSVSDLFPSLFEDDDEDNTKKPLPDDEHDNLVAEMDAINAALGKKRRKSKKIT